MSNSKNSECGDSEVNCVSSVSQLCRKLYPVVEKCISNIVEKEGFICYNISVKDISSNGGNYLGLLQELDLKGKSVKGDKEINLFLKNRIPAEDSNIFPLGEVYEKEAFYYNELMKIYNQFQDDGNIPKEDRLRTAKSYDETNSDVIILENLSKKGYTTCDRFGVPTLEFAQKSIKELAKFHALSFVLKVKMPKFFKERITSIKYGIHINSDWKMYLQNVYNSALHYLEGDYRRKMINFYPQMIESLLHYKNASANDAICLCHGDFRQNNILMLKKDDKIEDVVPIDFQLLNCEKPASDFLYFIFTGTDQAFRVAHLEELKELYYDTFEKFLRYLDISAQGLYSKKDFDDDIKSHLNYGITMGLMYTPFIFADNGNSPDIDNITKVKFKWNDVAIKRWREMVEFYVTYKNM